MITQSDIQNLLEQAYKPGILPESPYPRNFFARDPQSAAVLIPFCLIRENWHILFIRRTETPLDQHSGQVAFPGGRSEPRDKSSEQTAIREAHEELGIIPSDIHILGRLRDMLTITNYCITPIVGKIPWPYKFTPQENEVAHIFTIPLKWLGNPENREIQQRKLQTTNLRLPVIYFNKYDGELLWGASARITLLLLEALGLAKSDDRYNM